MSIQFHQTTLDNGMTIRVPTNNADAIGMREIIPKSAVEKVYEVLRDRKKPGGEWTLDEASAAAVRASIQNARLLGMGRVVVVIDP